MTMNSEKNIRKPKLIPGTLLLFVCALAGAFLFALGCALLERFEEYGEIAQASAPAALAVLFGGALACQSFSAALQAKLLVAGQSSVLPHLPAPLVYGAALLLCRFFCGKPLPIECLFVMIFYVGGFLLSRALLSGKGKTVCVLHVSIPAVAIVFLIFILHAMQECGFTVNGIAAYIRKVQEAFEAQGERTVDAMLLLGNSKGEMLKMMILQGILPNTATDESLRALLLEEYGSVFSSLVWVMPSVVIAAMNVLGFGAASFFSLMTGRGKRDANWMLVISGFGTALFVFSALLSTILAMFGGAGKFGILLVNIELIFLPAMFAIGIRTLKSLRREQIKRHVAIFVITIIFIVLNPIIMISAIGAYGNLMQRLKMKLSAMAGGNTPPD